MFQDMKKMTTLDISLIKVAKGATINYMFGKCPNLKTQEQEIKYLKEIHH